MDTSLPFYAIAGHILVVAGSLALGWTSLRSARPLVDDLHVNFGGAPSDEEVGRAADRARAATVGFLNLAVGLTLVVTHEFVSASASATNWLLGSALAAVGLVVSTRYGARVHSQVVDEARARREA